MILCEVYEANIDEFGYYEYSEDWLKAVSGKNEIHTGDYIVINGNSHKVLDIR